MSVNCTRCEGTGFLNLEQCPGQIVDEGRDAILKWIGETNAEMNSRTCTCEIDQTCMKCPMRHDVQVCDCCGDGVIWYDVPGEHYNSEDPPGDQGPYASNGGLCQCH